MLYSEAADIYYKAGQWRVWADAMAAERNQTQELHGSMRYRDVVGFLERYQAFFAAQPAADTLVPEDLATTAFAIKVDIAAGMPMSRLGSTIPTWVWIVGGLAVAGAAGGGIYLLSGTKKKKR